MTSIPRGRRSLRRACTTVGGRANPSLEQDPILIDDDEDDDDDVQIISPQALPKERIRPGKRREKPSRGNFVKDSTLNPSTSSTRRVGIQRSASLIIHSSTTSVQNLLQSEDDDDDCAVILVIKKKKKLQRASPDRDEDQPQDKAKLTCPVCFGIAKEETSTVCGHVFCKSCIHNAIKFQRKCPTCRKKLTVAQTHRVYLG